MQQVIMMPERLNEFPRVGQVRLPGDIIERPIFPTLHMKLLVHNHATFSGMTR
jgi:hypothetical protein